jgi:membrane protein YqaA with SNARE-associated domain
MHEGKEGSVSGIMHRYRIEIRYLCIAAVLLGALLLLQRLDAFSGIDSVVAGALEHGQDFGLVAVFLIALIGNMALLVQVPYTIPILAVALAGSTGSHMLGLGVAAGLGATIGGMVSYLIAEKVLARKPGLGSSKLYRWMMDAATTRPRRVSLVVFVGVVTPLPDDAVIIPLAMVKYGARRILLPLFTGKMVHNVAVALICYQFTAWAASSTSTHVRADLLIGVVLMFVLVILYQAEKARSATMLTEEILPIESAMSSATHGVERRPPG